MSLTLHHFLKEFRHLRWKWFAWLAVLVLQLVVDAEWIVPMRLGVPTPGWIGLLPVLTWGGAVMLALGYATEDAQADDRSFIAVRPLPRACFWFSRVLVVLLLIITPLVAMEGVYLTVSGVEAQDILLGMWERFFIAGALLAWLLPMPLMATGTARWALAATVLLTGLLLLSLSTQMLRHWQLYPEMFYGDSSLRKAAWIGAGAMALLAIRKKQRGWLLSRTLGAVVAVTMACFALAWTPLLRPSTWAPHEPALMAELERKHGDLPPPHSSRIYTTPDSETGVTSMTADGDLSALPTPAELLPSWRVLDAAVQQKGSVHHSKLRNPFHQRFFWLMAVQSTDDPWLLASLRGIFQERALSMDKSGSQRNHFALGGWPLPDDLQSPANIEAEMEADWTRQTVLGSCELRAGARLRSRYADVEVVKVSPHVDTSGNRRPGSVTVAFKFSKREIETGGMPFTYGMGVRPLIHAPEQSLVWQNDTGSGGDFQTRALHTGRQRAMWCINYADVLTPGTGIREEDLPKLRVLLRKIDYAGTSRHRLSLKDINLSEQLDREPWAYPARCPREAVNARAGFLREFQRISLPADDAGPEAVARLVADVVTLSHALSWRSDIKPDGSPYFPGDDQAVADAVAPYLLKHPQVLTRQPHVFVSAENPFVRRLLDATLLLAALPGITRDADGLRYDGPEAPNGVNRLLNPMEARVNGWKELAPAIEAALKQRSAAPILAVHEKWQQQLRTVIPDDELLDQVTKQFNVSSLRSLKDEAVRKKAREIIRREYARSVAPVMHPGSQVVPLIECAIAAGMEEALDHRLRKLRFLEHKNVDQDDLMELSMLHRLLGGPDEKLKLTWDEALTFLDRLRHLHAADFRYDAATMTWNPIAKP